MKKFFPILALAALSSSAQASLLYIAAYPNSVLVFDEAKGQIVNRIPLQTGLPRALKLSSDRKQMYVVTNDHSGIETIDLATNKIANHFLLNTPAKRYRFSGGMVADPAGKVLYTITTEIDKQIDRFEIGKPKYTVIDLAQQKIVKTVDVPREEENGFRGDERGNGFEISPDGKYLYQFGQKVSILNTSDFKVVDTIELSKPDSPDMNEMENLGFGAALDSIGEPGKHISVFNSSDPIVHSRVFGIARLDLTTRQVDFNPIGPAPTGMAGLQVAPDKKHAYTVVSTGNHGTKRCEFWAFDLTAGDKITDTAEVPCRTRFTFGMSGDGQKLYIYAAGYQIEIYDAKTLKYEKTWDLTNDMTGAMIVMPTTNH